jgi:hypothetical protein
MKICLLGLDNVPVLAPEYREHTIGGESVQQTLLARALARRGHEVSMVTADYGQTDAALWEGIRVYKAYRPEAGLPLLRFVHPRWSGLWSALARADAQLYYTSCAGMQVALLALFCARHGRRFVFRCASDADCDPSQLLIRHAPRPVPWRATTASPGAWPECWSSRPRPPGSAISTFCGSQTSGV